jgi:crotonobetainyl-CoA:carnitine CoA-transferase CaiB-like acyl-CoA transferase
MLADFGAEVVKIEDRKRMDLTRRLPIYNGEPPRTISDEDLDPDPNRSGFFNNYNRNKLSVTINMRTQEGRALAESLISASSVVTENFAPGVMERWGLTYERLQALCGDVIYARMSGFGHDGPYQAYRSYGPVVQAFSGLTHISGLPGSEPSGWGFSYMDNMAAYHSTAAILLAIYNRNQTGNGCEIDVSATDVGITLLGSVLLDVTVNGRRTRRPDFPLGNRLDYPSAAPHGVYRCLDEDRWCAIAVFSDEEWQRLVSAMGSPAWTRDERFETLEKRVQCQDLLDARVEEWTRDRDAHEIMRLLQSAGVCAGAVQTSKDLAEYDPQLRHRSLFFRMNHPVVGDGLFEGTPFKIPGAEPDHWRSAPLLGEDNDYVFSDLLRLSEVEIQDLKRAGAIY